MPISACLGGNTLDHPCRTKGEKVLYNILFSVHSHSLFPFKTYVKGDDRSQEEKLEYLILQLAFHLLNCGG